MRTAERTAVPENRTTGKPLRADERFARYWAIILAALVLVTYRLWLPPVWTQTAYYPAVPFAPLPGWLSACVSMILLPVIAAACMLIALRPENTRIRGAAWLVIALFLAAGFLTDQHRLQPWAYQSFLYAWLFGLLPASLQMVGFRVLTISIYFYSAIGKFDYQFLHTVGQEFLTIAARFAHQDVSQWSDQSRLVLAAGFPAAELSIAILLMIPPTRFIGGWLAIAMHVGLIAFLSPWGLHHSPGVLVWNAALAGQAYWLFVRPPILRPLMHQATRRLSPGTLLAGVLILLAITLPLTERRGRHDGDAWHWDHWTSWALYSPHNSRVDIEIHAGAISSLPPSIQWALDEDADGDSWSKLDLGKLSLHARGVPVLPQARYQLQLAIAIAQAQGWTDQVRGILRSTSDRRDGSRREVWMNRLAAMKKTERERP